MSDTIKALSVKLVNGRCEQCEPEDATHVQLHMPGPSGRLTLPVIRSGPRAGTPCWTWNGSVTSPTMRPSVRTRGHNYLCHSWITDGAVQFLSDCTHDLAGQTVPLLPVEGGEPMILEADAHAAWRAHIARYCVCPQCGGDGEYEGAMNTVDPQKPGDPVLLREVVECPGCGHRWYEVWQYSGQAPIPDDAT